MGKFVRFFKSWVHSFLLVILPHYLPLSCLVGGFGIFKKLSEFAVLLLLFSKNVLELLVTPSEWICSFNLVFFQIVKRRGWGLDLKSKVSAAEKSYKVLGG